MKQELTKIWQKGSTMENMFLNRNISKQKKAFKKASLRKIPTAVFV